MRAMILSAGFGKRLLPLTEHTPKALMVVADEPLIAHHLRKLATIGTERVVINLGHLGHKIRDYVGNGKQFELEVLYSEESPPLETGGGILKALPLLGSNPFIVCSVDIYSNFPYETLPKTLTGLAHLVLVDNPPWHPKGDFGLSGGYIVSDECKPKLNFAGIYVLHPQLFDGCPQGHFRIPSLLYPAIARQQVTGEHYRGMWHNIGTMAQLANLQGMTAL